MAKHQHYGERMAEWERDQDEHNWKNSLRYAIQSSNQLRIEELVNEGIAEGYSFSEFSEPIVADFLKRFSH